MARVLIVEDEPNMRKVLSANLRQDAHMLIEASTLKEGLQAVYGNDFDVVLLDQKLPDGEGTEVLKAIQQSEPSTAVVMLSAYGTVELAVEAMRIGAFDFLTKPFSPDNLRAVVRRAAERAQLHRENYLLRSAVDRLEGQSEIRGSSPAAVKLRELISRVGPTGATVLITGETGTGKELVARAIHKSSQRASKPLISVNCAAFSETLLESELFGHERGAFTGADRTRYGLFEAAHEGPPFSMGPGGWPLQRRQNYYACWEKERSSAWGLQLRAMATFGYGRPRIAISGKRSGREDFGKISIIDLPLFQSRSRPFARELPIFQRSRSTSCTRSPTI